jgi:hypothetical protein
VPGVFRLSVTVPTVAQCVLQKGASASITQFVNPLFYFFLGEFVEFNNLYLIPKLGRHHLHRCIATVEFDDQPACVYAGLATPVGMCEEMATVPLDCVKSTDTDFMIAAVR